MTYIVHALLLAVVLMAPGGEGEQTDNTITPGLCKYGWGEWHPWTPCDVSCGVGHQNRTRLCFLESDRCSGLQPELQELDVLVEGGRLRVCVPAIYCGLVSNIETRECYGAVTGNWSEWGCWGECTNGTRQRHRSCNNPVPTGAGNYCVGNHTETKKCCAEGHDIIFVIDRSSSFYSTYINVIIDQMNSVFQLLDLDTGSGSLGKVRVGIELFDHNQLAVKHLNNFNFPDKLYSHTEEGINISAAITFAHKTMFTISYGDRIEAPNTMVLITGGWSELPDPALAATAAKNDGIEIIVVGHDTGPGLNEDGYISLVSDPDTDVFNGNILCSSRHFLMKRLTCNEGETEGGFINEGPVSC